MDEGGGLENRYTRKGIVGSNPTPSASQVFMKTSNPESKRFQVSGRVRIFPHDNPWVCVSVPKQQTAAWWR